ncbi:hypothetical protein ES705_17563 [subsurface metagenome]
MISDAEKFNLLDRAHRRDAIILPCGKVLDDGYVEYPGIAAVFYYYVPGSKSTHTVMAWRLDENGFCIT